MTRLIGAILAGVFLLSTDAQAQSISGSSSGRMWGGNTGSSGAAWDSSAMHVQDGNAAGQVNAAKAGLLYGGQNLSITAIGSQNIVSTTVIGDGNSTNVNTTQTSSNSATVTNNGTINPR